jgi:hypothetical protein
MTGAREKVFLQPRWYGRSERMAGAPVERDVAIIPDSGIAGIVE